MSDNTNNAITMSMRRTFPIPVRAEELVRFLARFPDEAEIKIVTFEGDDQRDPYPTAYILSAQWEVEES